MSCHSPAKDAVTDIANAILAGIAAFLILNLAYNFGVLDGVKQTVASNNAMSAKANMIVRVK